MNNQQDGFTTVELLVTLFVAAAFVTMGYQLYIAVIRDGAQVRQRVAASNIAQDHLQRKATQMPACSESGITTQETNDSQEYPPPNVNIESTISAPYGCPFTDNIMKVQVTVTYGEPGREESVTHAVYIKK